MIDGNETAAFFTGVIVVLIILAVIWNIEESACQVRHDVADCEWVRTPFQPAETEQ